MRHHPRHLPGGRMTICLQRLYRPLIILSLLSFALAAAPHPATGAEGNLVLHFDSGSTALTPEGRTELGAFMKAVDLGKAGKVLVVGHADATGKRKENLAISRKRASGVRKILIDKLGTPAERVLMVGQGSDAPVAGNDTDKGRARNRRVVVSLVDVAPAEIQRRYGGNDPRLVAVDALLGEADGQLRLGRYDEALASLHRAAQLGGDRYSRWHTSYGIVGFLGGQPPHKLRGYFEKALALDPHDSDARDFLGRVEARQAFQSGRILPTMGRTPETAIKVTTHSQAYEYLRLFGVEPLSRATLDPGAMEVWTCRSGENEAQEVVYYFDASQMLEWAYPTKNPRNRMGAR